MRSEEKQLLAALIGVANALVKATDNLTEAVGGITGSFERLSGSVDGIGSGLREQGRRAEAAMLEARRGANKTRKELARMAELAQAGK